MAMRVMSMTMRVMSMTVMVPSPMVVIMMAVIIAGLALRINIARIVIVIGRWHHDHAREADVNIDRRPGWDDPYADRQPREHGGDDDACHADLLR